VCSRAELRGALRAARGKDQPELGDPGSGHTYRRTELICRDLAVLRTTKTMYLCDLKERLNSYSECRIALLTC